MLPAHQHHPTQLRKHSTHHPSRAFHPGHVTSREFARNQAVEVEWGTEWLPATISHVTKDTVLVKIKAQQTHQHQQQQQQQQGRTREGGEEEQEERKLPPGSQVPEQLWLPRNSRRLREAAGEGGGVIEYQDLVRYMQELDMRVRFQGVGLVGWFASLLAAAAALVFLLQDDFRYRLGREGAEVASSSLQDKKVREASVQVAREVILQLLKSPDAVQGGAGLVKEVLEEAAIKAATKELVVGLYRDEALTQETAGVVRGSVEGLSLDRQTQADVHAILHAATANLFSDPEFVGLTAALLRDLLSFQDTREQTAALSTMGLHQVLSEPQSHAFAASSLQQLLQDPYIRKETADALSAVVRTLMTLGFNPPPRKISRNSPSALLTLAVAKRFSRLADGF